MFGFGKKKDLSTPAKGKIFEKIAETRRGMTGKMPPLRILLAEALGGTSPDGPEVTGMLNDLFKNADFRAPRPADVASWWDGASDEQRLSALTTAADGMK